MVYPLPWGERVRVRGKGSYDHPHLNPPIKGEESFSRIRCPAALLRGTSLISSGMRLMKRNHLRLDEKRLKKIFCIGKMDGN